ncbi:FHA domain-containing protein [Salinibacterium sp. ZJ450]|uniref:FHA domain-containing protein n=1 Tax=Salinibacterium sp. ZJ450 TaxID=2708338 RepID=UPI0014203DE8|nr:FHA domain-containing protein [Salinibacterium sp. ZJ450]
MTLSFSPDAGWPAVTTATRLVAIDGSDSAVVRAVASIDATAGFQAVLDVLLRAGISSAPQFALVDWSGADGIRVVLRGDAAVSISTPEGERRLSGAGIATWAEQLFPVGEFVLSVPGGHWSSAAPVAAVAAPSAPASAAVAAHPAPAQASAGTVDAEITIVPAEVSEPVPVIVPALVPAAASAPGTAPSEADGYDYLFGATVVRPVFDAAIRDDDALPADDPDDSDAPPADDLLGDHDGHTVMSGDIAAARQRRAQHSTAVADPAPESVPALELPDGRLELLDEPLIIGRAPSVSQVSGGELPRLVTLDGDQDVSRNHLRVALEGGTVVVTDLHSRNGTSVVLPGRNPQKLRDGDPTAVIVGTIIDLGGGITITVREA